MVTTGSVWSQTSQLTSQSAADIAQEQRRQQQREQAERQRLEQTPDVRLPAGVPSTFVKLPTGEAPCFRLEQLELAGKDKKQFSWLLHVLGGEGNLDTPFGKCLGAQGVAIVFKRAQDALVAKGYVTSRVLAEAQDISSGKLVLTVIPGRIRAIRFVEPIDVRGTAWNAMPAKPGDILNLRDIEQGLESFKRVPTTEADIKIAPANGPDAKPNESDLLISYKQGVPFRVSLSVDDSGSKATGKYQGALSISVDNMLTLSDLFYVTLNQDMGGGQAGRNAQGTNGNTIHYSVPFGYWTVGATVNNSRYFQTVAGINQNYVYSGSSSTAEAKLSRLLFRDASRKTTLSLKAFQRRSKNFIEDTEVQVQRRSVGGWEFGAAHREYIGPATLDANLAYKRGTGAFGSLPAPEESFGEGTSRFSLVNADAGLNWPFKLASQQMRYSANVRAQTNGAALTPQDRFAIGGRYTVRGFDGESSLSAERGWFVRNELGFVLADSGQELYAGLDHGEVAGPSNDLLVGRTLTGAVIGLRGGLKNFQYDCFISTPVQKPVLFRTANTNAGCSLNLSF